MLVTPHKLYIQKFQGLQQFIQPDSQPKSHQFISGFKNKINQSYQWLLIKQSGKLALASCYRLHGEISFYINYLYQLEQYEKLSEEEKQQAPLPKQDEPEIHQKFQQFLKDKQINCLYHLCNAIIVSEESEIYNPQQIIPQEKLTLIRSGFDNVESAVLDNAIIKMFNSLEELQKAGLDNLLRKSNNPTLTKQELVEIDNNLSLYAKEQLLKVPKLNPETGQWNSAETMELKLQKQSPIPQSN